MTLLAHLTQITYHLSQMIEADDTIIAKRVVFASGAFENPARRHALSKESSLARCCHDSGSKCIIVDLVCGMATVRRVF